MPQAVPSAPVPLGRQLRGPALAVLVLAAAVILTDTLALVLELVQSGSTVMQYVMQGIYLVMLVAGLLFTAAVLWLLASSRRGQRRAGSLPLLALGLLTLSALLAPAAQLLSLGLQQLGVGGDSPSGYSVRYLLSAVLTTGGGILLTLAIGVLALLLLLRPQLAERTSAIRLGPVPVAAGLLVLALLAAALISLQGVLLRALTSGGEGIMTVNSLLSTGQMLLAALMIPALGLLLALTTGRPHALVWAGAGLYWVSRAVAVVLARVYVFQLLADAEIGGDWLPLATGVVNTVGALMLAAAAAVVLGLCLVRRSRDEQHRRVSDHDPIH